MNIYESAKLLQLNGTITLKEVKTAYRRACKEYHPDHNPGGLEMMKSINLAYDCLKEHLSNNETIELKLEESVSKFGDELMAVINALSDTDLILELCGSWLWISGPTKAHKELLKTLKCKWAPKKKLWYYRPEDYRSRARKQYDMDDIRARHGSQSVRGQAKRKLSA